MVQYFINEACAPCSDMEPAEGTIVAWIACESWIAVQAKGKAQQEESC